MATPNSLNIDGPHPVEAQSSACLSDLLNRTIQPSIHQGHILHRYPDCTLCCHWEHTFWPSMNKMLLWYFRPTTRFRYSGSPPQIEWYMVAKPFLIEDVEYLFSSSTKKEKDAFIAPALDSRHKEIHPSCFIFIPPVSYPVYLWMLKLDCFVTCCHYWPYGNCVVNYFYLLNMFLKTFTVSILVFVEYVNIRLN